MDNPDINRIFRYSAIKINVNKPPPNSVLNPDTNSLSPSTRSNGVRLSSANIVEIQTYAVIRFIMINIEFLVFMDEFMFNLGRSSNTLIRMKAILTSYEIVWATLRIEPSRAYLEFDAHLAARVE